ncbi:MAG: LuxR C-terminal-related transcriptional regulator [Hyphomicrobiaceae bacterium]
MAEPGAKVAHSDANPRTLLVIADRNPVVRAGLQDFLSRDGRYTVAAAVETGAELLACCENHRAQIAVIGWILPDATAVDLMATAKRRQIHLRPVIYASEDGPEVLRQAVRAGAWGFVSRNDDPNMLLETLASVSRGRMCLPYIDIERLASDPIDLLTRRERELLGALAQGWTNLQIGARFGISGNTVKYHLKNLYDKLGVKNRAMAVALYMSSSGAAAHSVVIANDADDDDWR